MATLYFEDFAVGTAYRSREHTVTAEEIEQFAKLTGDFTSLHLSDEAAAKTPFGRRIAHGALIFSLSVGLKTQTIDTNASVIAFYGLDKLRFTAPTFIGDRIHVEKTVIAVEAKDEARGVITSETKVVNQDGKVVQVYIDKLMIRRRN
jgi:3-hydroxybutyryl-CoA dehydratase